MPETEFIIKLAMGHHFRLVSRGAPDNDGKCTTCEDVGKIIYINALNMAEPITLKTFGPPGRMNSLLHWRDPTSAMP